MKRVAKDKEEKDEEERQRQERLARKKEEEQKTTADDEPRIRELTDAEADEMQKEINEQVPLTDKLIHKVMQLLKVVLIFIIEWI